MMKMTLGEMMVWAAAFSRNHDALEATDSVKVLRSSHQGLDPENRSMLDQMLGRGDNPMWAGDLKAPDIELSDIAATQQQELYHFRVSYDDTRNSALQSFTVKLTSDNWKLALQKAFPDADVPISVLNALPDDLEAAMTIAMYVENFPYTIRNLSAD
jgi:hypothetical protein